MHFALCNRFFPAVLQTHCKSQRASNKLVLDAGLSGFIMIYLCTWWSWWLFCTLFPCLYDFMLALICFFLHMCNLISALTYQYPSEIPIIYTHRYAYSPLVTPPQYAVSYLCCVLPHNLRWGSVCRAQRRWSFVGGCPYTRQGNPVTVTWWALVGTDVFLNFLNGVDTLININ